MADGLQTFKRYELKYMLNIEKYNKLLDVMQGYMKQDEYGRHTIRNIYYDTDDYLLIRRSLEKPMYKEKLRVRSYGDSETVFVELKKKYKGVVYKRRLKMTDTEAEHLLLDTDAKGDSSQICNEILYFKKFYNNLRPKVRLNYEREAFFGLEDANFRMTFDHNVRIHKYETEHDFSAKKYPVIDGDCVLLEVKTEKGLPFWLLKFFEENEVYKTSFSKYGTAYNNWLLGSGCVI